MRAVEGVESACLAIKLAPRKDVIAIDQNKSLARSKPADSITKLHRVNFINEDRAHKWFPE